MWESDLKKQSCLHQTLKRSSRQDTTASWLTKIQIAKSVRHRHRGGNVANLTFLLRSSFVSKGVYSFVLGCTEDSCEGGNAA